MRVPVSSIKIALFPALSRTPIRLDEGLPANLVSGGLCHPKPRLPIRERSSFAVAPLCETAPRSGSWGIHGFRRSATGKSSEDKSRRLRRLHRRSFHTRRGGAFQRIERRFQHGDVDMAQERREPLLLFPCDFPHAIQRA